MNKLLLAATSTMLLIHIGTAAGQSSGVATKPITPLQRQAFASATSASVAQQMQGAVLYGDAPFEIEVRQMLKGAGVEIRDGARTSYAIRLWKANNAIQGSITVSETSGNRVPPYTVGFQCRVTTEKPAQGIPADFNFRTGRTSTPTSMSLDMTSFREALNELMIGIYGEQGAKMAKEQMPRMAQAAIQERTRINDVLIEKFKTYKIGVTTESEFLADGWGTNNIMIGTIGVVAATGSGKGAGNIQCTMGYLRLSPDSRVATDDASLAMLSSMFEEFLTTGGQFNANIVGAAPVVVCKIRFSRGMLEAVDWDGQNAPTEHTEPLFPDSHTRSQNVPSNKPPASDIIRIPSLEEMTKGAKIEVIKASKPEGTNEQVSK